MVWQRKNLLGLEELTAEEINFVLDSADSFKEISTREIKKVPALRGKTVANLFFEPSTRTRMSFELAAKRLSADLINFSPSSSSLVKGETLIDTVKNVEAFKVNIIVVRHSVSGFPYCLSEFTNAAIINAGDGAHEHPTQALLDIYTIREKKGKISGLKVAIIGDILHSRVARSNIWGLTKLGAEVILCGPLTLLPREVEKLPVRISFDFEEVIREADVLYFLRIQKEREKRSLFPSLREYANFFGLNKSRLELLKKGCLIMHPGPVNRGVELDPEVADGPRAVILEQVTNGLAIRMAVLYILSGVPR